MPAPKSKAQARLFQDIAAGRVEKEGFSPAEAKRSLAGVTISKLPERKSMAKNRKATDKEEVGRWLKWGKNLTGKPAEKPAKAKVKAKAKPKAKPKATSARVDYQAPIDSPKAKPAATKPAKAAAARPAEGDGNIADEIKNKQKKLSGWLGTLGLSKKKKKTKRAK